MAWFPDSCVRELRSQIELHNQSTPREPIEIMYSRRFYRLRRGNRAVVVVWLDARNFELKAGAIGHPTKIDTWKATEDGQHVQTGRGLLDLHQAATAILLLVEDR